jgi:hypothetical protein
MDSRSRLGRSAPRQRRRLKVTFQHAASFTSDVGGGGFSTERARVLAPGMELSGTICAADREFPFVGRVAWARPGDPGLNLRGRMGVQFTYAARDLRSLLSAPPPRPESPPGRPAPRLPEAA